jgi:hypothetical protein
MCAHWPGIYRARARRSILWKFKTMYIRWFFFKYYIIIFLHFGLWSLLADKLHVHPLFMKLDFINQPSSKSTLPLARLQHMQYCQVGWDIPISLFAPSFWSKWMAPEKWSLQWGGLNLWNFIHESSAFTTRPRLLAF